LPKRTERFWERVQDVFNNAKAPEIARRLGLEKQAVYKWRDGSLPGVDTLLAIAETTGCSLHWLLTGEGSKEVTHDLSKPLLKLGAQIDNSSLSEEDKKAVRQEILKVLSALLSGQDRGLVDFLLNEIRLNINGREESN